MSTQQSMPHNGNLLWKMMVQQRFTKSELAVAMNTNQMAIKRFIDKPSIGAADLWKLSSVLGVNLLDMIAKQHPIQSPSEKEIALQQQVTDLQKENTIYKDLLKSR